MVISITIVRVLITVAIHYCRIDLKALHLSTGEEKTEPLGKV